MFGRYVADAVEMMVMNDRHRRKCECKDWPKPCGYHEGYEDAIGEIVVLMELVDKTVEAARDDG